MVNFIYNTWISDAFVRFTNNVTNRTARNLLLFITVVGMVVVCINFITHKDNCDDGLFLPITRPQPLNFENKFAINTPGCKIPSLDPYHLTLRRFIAYQVNRPLKCTTPQLIFVENNTLRLNIPEIRRFRNISCGFTPFHRKSENNYEYYSIFQPVGNSVVIIDEFIMAECRQDTTQIYQDFFPQIIRKKQVENRCEKASRKMIDGTKLSVLILGIDSVAKTEYLRHMLKTDWFIRKKLSFIELHGYNKIGLNTFPNVLALLTGHHEHEFNITVSKDYLDVLPFIWKNFSEKGYRTLIAEDSPSMTGFNYAKKGFNNQPTDYYLRPLSNAVENSNMEKMIDKEGCFHNRTESSVILKWTEDLLDKFSGDPIFAYTFLTRLTHDDYDGVAYLDAPVFNFFERLYDKGHLNRSIVFFFSDHGYRFGKSRMTSEGHVEEKLPFFFIILPDWFMSEYPKFYKSLKLNERRLVTAFDVHATLVDILNSLENVRNVSELERSVSLFTPISSLRTCQIASIDALYCTCADRHEIPKNGAQVVKAANLLVDRINNVTKMVRRQCVKLELSDVLKATAQKFNVDVGKRSASYVITFQLTIKVMPSEAIFEGIVLYHGRREEFSVDHEIDRVNLYGDQSHCMSEVHLKQFCFCNDSIVIKQA